MRYTKLLKWNTDIMQYFPENPTPKYKGLMNKKTLILHSIYKYNNNKKNIKNIVYYKKQRFFFTK